MTGGRRKGAGRDGEPRRTAARIGRRKGQVVRHRGSLQGCGGKRALPPMGERVSDRGDPPPIMRDAKPFPHGGGAG
ncbi:MAG: hypothetical protein AB1665_06130 [Candidatus Thermoplasmatota archaeon]